ncbi:glycosyltransferase [Brucella pituitosa]|uniref:glycosyltransferase n=1 Tax=Brucella pituitosa TaxID=571256 RepID=UPI003F4AC8B6
MIGLNVIGMPFGAHGLGQELRDKVRALTASGVKLCIIEQNFSSIRRTVADPDIAELICAEPIHSVNLICHNLPATNLIAQKSPELLAGRYNIGAPYWEFPEIPASHKKGLNVLDELWTSNRFLTECYAPVYEKPIMQMPLHLPKRSLPPNRVGQRSLTFGYIFDFNSLAARKDPFALLVSFLECFASRPQLDVRLRIKYSMEPSRLVNPMDVEDFLRLAALDDRIELIDRQMTDPEMIDFMNSLDVYVSPHRAEGLGRGIIEAMMHGKAVIATSYSGPSEFMTENNSFPVDWFPSHVGASAIGDIKPSYSWAEVKMESLISIMKQVSDERDIILSRGSAAKDLMDKNHGPKRFSEAVLSRLKDICVNN